MLVKRMLKTAMALTLCAALAALGLSALLFSSHCCCNENCSICLTISEALQLTRAALVLAVAVAMAVLCLLAGREMGLRVGQRPVPSLVLMKTELLN